MSEQKINFSALENQLIDLSREIDSEEDLLNDALEEVIQYLIREERYQTLEIIDSGGVKNIYQMMDKHTGRILARAELKTSDSPALERARVINEARLTARLEHPHIIPIHDINCSDENEPFFTMKLLKGENLAEVLAKLHKDLPDYREKYSLYSLLDIFNKICSAVEYAHSKGIIHLDLKPENIHIGDYGEVFVVDWGLARETKITNENICFDKLRDMLNLKQVSSMGTPGYMSPEQITQSDSELDERTDIYALGAILYSLLSLTRPCLATSTDKIISETLANKFVSPIERAKGLSIPLALNAVVCKAMSKQASERYQSVHELATEIKAFLGGYATLAEQAGLMHNIYLLYKRNQVRFQLAGFFILLISVLSSLFVIRLKESEQEARAHESEAIKNLQRFETARIERQQERSEKKKLLRNAAPIILKGQHLYQVDLEYETARKLMMVFLNLTPNDAEGNLELARLLMSEFKFQEALYYFNKSQRLGHPFELREKHLLETCQKLNQFVRDHQPKPSEIILKLTELNPFEHVNAYACLRFHKGQQNINIKKRTAEQILAIRNQCSIKPFIMDQNQQFILSLNHPEIKHLSGITGFPIKEIDLSNSSVFHLRYLQRSQLKKINISNTPINDLSPLYGLPLEELIMRNIFCIVDFRKIKTLKKLDLQGSMLNVKSRLDKLSQLIELNIAHTNFVDFKDLKKLKNLKKLTLSKDTLTEKQLAQLHQLNIETIILESSHE